ncbi:MAG TPA: RNA-binding protein, partial [Lachnospiraceae bacterium]|nr:RNA-binding protein [Lachnospiraceae bacterium]
LNELNILHTTPKNQFDVPYEVFGGYAFSERQMAAFLPDAFSLYLQTEGEKQAAYPIEVLQIRPLQKKFAAPMSHRDYLGAILNLGIERCKIGDILAEPEEAYVFVKDTIADYICDQLTRVRHTPVLAVRTELSAFQYHPRFEVIRGSVASVRLDTLLALAFSASRSKLTALIEGGRVFVNGKLITSNGYQIHEQDIISVRGLGRFRFLEVASTTKKGRLYVTIEKYI